MPEEWHRKILDALDSGWVTGVAAAIDALSKQHPESQEFCIRLTDFLDQYEYDKLREQLKEVGHV